MLYFITTNYDYEVELIESPLFLSSDLVSGRVPERQLFVQRQSDGDGSGK